MNKPSDLAVMAGIFALVIITAGFLIASGVNNGGQSDTRVNLFINNIYEGMNGTDGLANTGVYLEQGILSTNASVSTNNQASDNILVQGWNSLKKLGTAFSIVSESVQESNGLFGIDPIYWLILSAMLLITFAVVMWSWFIGGSSK